MHQGTGTKELWGGHRRRENPPEGVLFPRGAALPASLCHPMDARSVAGCRKGWDKFTGGTFPLGHLHAEMLRLF